MCFGWLIVSLNRVLQDYIHNIFSAGRRGLNPQWRRNVNRAADTSLFGVRRKTKDAFIRATPQGGLFLFFRTADMPRFRKNAVRIRWHGKL